MKNIVITGANRGVGLALTKLFSEDNIVYALCRGNFPEKELNDHIIVETLDITNETAIINFSKKLDNEQVSVDLLINNAGISGGDMTKKAESNYSLVAEVYETNAIGPMILTLRLTAALKRAENPVMFAISSKMGTHAMIDSYSAEWWPYSSSKAALSLAVSAYAANEPGIKSISIHPGWVKTRMGGEEADIEPEESAAGIKELYDSIDTLETGKLYTFDGNLMGW